MQPGQLSDVRILTRSQHRVRQHSPPKTTHGTGAYHEGSAAVLPGLRRHLRGRRGGLKDMPEMPLDILFEIFAFLHPRDLLNLARATREFRALLMGRQSARFWREARQQVEGLPDPPSYLSEPAYANLLFSTHCHICLKPNVQNVLCTFSVRYCDPCQAHMFVHEREVSTFLLETFQYPWLPYVNSQYNSSRFLGSKYHKPEIDEIKRKWATLRDDDEKAKFKADRKAFVDECQQFSRLLSEWQTVCKIQRSQEGHKLKNERFEAVKQKLREEGFAEVLDYMRMTDILHLKKLGCVNRPSKLTEKGWKSIRPSIIQYMVPLREKYFQECREKVYRAGLAHLRQALDAHQSNDVPRTAALDCEPGFFELATMPAFQAILRDGQSNDVKEEAIATQLDIHNLVDSWTDYYKNVFTELALKGLGECSATLDLSNLLNLAVVCFACTRCKRRRLRWPHVLAHRCFRDMSTSMVHYGIEPSFLVHTRSSHDVPYRGEELVRFDDHLAVARSIISLCGLAPDTATYADMEVSGARLVCWCCPIITKRMVFDWKAAIQHSTIIHPTDGADSELDPFWERIPPGQAATADALERALLSRNGTLASLSQNPLNVFGCARCTWHGDFVNAKFHLRSVHQRWIDEPLLGEDVYLHEDSKPCGAPSVWMYPSAQPLYSDIQEGLLAGRGFLASF
ncbi:hypothetical protein LXA43DRAFT_991437 [Ganoderma leucocontextum]|nr:hypothetical protein LXA43DRAFT_991437 [Ganoderma leucocontextum]